VKNPKELKNKYTFVIMIKAAKEQRKKKLITDFLMFYVSYGRLFICCDIRNGVGSPGDSDNINNEFV
jgi:hypothetical protein